MARAAYPLQPLLDVRHFRENAAAGALRLAERALREAEDDEQRRRDELTNYRAWRPDEEERRYDAIMGQDMALADLDRFKAGLAALAQGELLREEEVRTAERATEACRKAVLAAREAAAQARRDTMKIATHRDIWREAARREAERLEDLEMEEFRTPPSPEGDDL